MTHSQKSSVEGEFSFVCVFRFVLTPVKPGKMMELNSLVQLETVNTFWTKLPNTHVS